MENTRYNGLAGKARRARNLHRASRIYAQQMIDEYLYPELETTRPERVIPIRSRHEFLPSAAFFREETSQPAKRQLELSLAGGTSSTKRSLPEPLIGILKFTDAVKRDSVIRPRKAPTQSTPQRTQKESPFTPRGFFFGCALGSAAAAVVLLVVQIAVG